MRDKFNPTYLNEAGLNLQFVFDIENLPQEMRVSLFNSVADISKYSQLILIGHGGTKLWQELSKKDRESANPIDDFSITKVTTFLEETIKNKEYKILYPGKTVISLQSLGSLAGWHNPSLLRIGINEKWGSWFAYRVAVLAASNFEIKPIMQKPSPCVSCIKKECVSSCPAGAINEDKYEHQKCFDYRLSKDSLCKDRCLARMNCPMASEQRYTEEQIKYHYGLSLKSLEKL